LRYMTPGKLYFLLVRKTFIHGESPGP